MLDQNAINYVQAQLTAGYSPESIQQALRQAGWSEADVLAAFQTPLSSTVSTEVPRPTHQRRGLKITLIVLGIMLFIGLLIGVPMILITSMTVVSLDRASSQADEVKRKSDLKQLQTAVELYFSNNNVYPSELNEVQPDYISNLPEDSVTEQPYYYESLLGGKDYKICPPDYQTDAECLSS